jgi:hypothetical protein
MADASRLKRLGAPPSLEEARVDLALEPVATRNEPTPETPTMQAVPVPKPEPEFDEYERIDGRSLRKTGRTVPFSTRVSLDLDNRIRRIAAKHRMLIVEIIEQGVDLLEEKLKRR